MTTNFNIRTVAEEYTQRIWDHKDLTAIEDLLHPEIVIHSLIGDYHGKDHMVEVVSAWIKGFPDILVKNNLVICERDLVMIQWQTVGTHLGEFKGVKPTGKNISYEGVTGYRIANGKITEYWAYLDMQKLLQQLS